MEKRKVTIWELHDNILTIQYDWKWIDWAVTEKVFEVEDNIFNLLSWEDWAKEARRLFDKK